MTTLAEAVLTVMLQLSPESRWTAMPGHAETVETRRERYASIARDIAEVAGDRGASTSEVALIVAHQFHESGWAPDVDGPTGCVQDGKWKGRCDSNRSACVHQIMAGPKRNRVLRTDRKECIREGLAALRRSLATCKQNAPAHRLAGLSGRCHGTAALAGSRRIWTIWTMRAEPTLSAAIAEKS